MHTTNEAVSQSIVFLYEPDFIAQLADLVHPDHEIPISLRTVALLTLDTVSRIRSKAGEVTSALSVSVNHGTLMSILRKLASDVQAKHSEDMAVMLCSMTNDLPLSAEATSEYIDALFNFIMHLQTTGYAGNMLLGAGIIPLLVELAKDSKPSNEALLISIRAVTFLDNFTYSLASAASPFAAAGGLQVFVERISQLVKIGVDLDSNLRGDMEIEGSDTGKQ